MRKVIYPVFSTLALACACLPAGAQTITTVAGIKPPALNSEINYPNDTASDAAGNLYIADSANNVIRKVAPDGSITTVAGNGTAGYSGDTGAATSAELDYPEGVTVDSSGNLYIADSYNNVIREVDTNGKITTVVGNGTAGFNGDGKYPTSTELDFPTAVVADTIGQLYIADAGNQRIRMLVYPTRLGQTTHITTVAGNGTAGYNNFDEGAAATTAELSFPSGVALDSAGNLYISDTDNQRIRWVGTNGIINTIAGNGTAGYANGSGANTEINYPQQIAVDASNNLYIADVGNDLIRKIHKINLSGTPTFYISTVAGNGTAGYSGDGGAATSAQLRSPFGISVGATGDLYIADTNNQSIRRVGTDGNIATVVGTIYSFAGYYGDGGPSGFSGDNGPATSAKLNNPYATAVDAGGNIYIADENNNRVRKITVNGIITTFAGNGTPGSTGDGGAALNAELNSPAGVAVDNAGNVYIAEYHGQRVRKVSGTGVITTVAGNGTAGYRSADDGGQATSAELNYPIGITVGANNNLYIADADNARIRKVAGGIITTVAGNGTGGYNGDNISATSAELLQPYDVAVDSAGNIYIADTGNARIRKVATNGIITTVAGTGNAGYTGDGGPATSANIHNPSGIAVDALGTVFIADQINDVVRVFKPGGNISTLAGTGYLGYMGDGGAATSAQFNVPVGVTVDAKDNVYIADYYSSRIRKVTGFASDRIFANGFEH